MPFGDGTGPLGQGPNAGRGRGRGRGKGRGGSRGRIRMGRPNAGPVGNCICPSCGAKAPHQAGAPCGSLECPKCGSRMVRE